VISPIQQVVDVFANLTIGEFVDYKEFVNTNFAKETRIVKLSAGIVMKMDKLNDGSVFVEGWAKKPFSEDIESFFYNLDRAWDKQSQEAYEQFKGVK
jgi:hypothetical protein